MLCCTCLEDNYTVASNSWWGTSGCCYYLGRDISKALVPFVTSPRCHKVIAEDDLQNCVF